MKLRESNELVPGLVLPPGYERAVRGRLLDIEDAQTGVNCLILQARVEGLETLTQGIVPSACTC